MKKNFFKILWIALVAMVALSMIISLLWPVFS